VLPCCVQSWLLSPAVSRRPQVARFLPRAHKCLAAPGLPEGWGLISQVSPGSLEGPFAPLVLPEHFPLDPRCSQGCLQEGLCIHCAHPLYAEMKVGADPQVSLEMQSLTVLSLILQIVLLS